MMLHSQMDKIIDHLYLGDIQGASNMMLLKRNGITHILQVAAGFKPFFPGEFSYMVINVLDMPFENIMRHFKQAIEFIRGAIKSGGNVLVHCFAGVSRSASVVIAYLMKELGLPVLDALTYTRKRRPIVFPNPGFQRQLFEFEKHLRVHQQKAMLDYQEKKQKRINEQQQSLKINEYSDFVKHSPQAILKSEIKGSPYMHAAGKPSVQEQLVREKYPQLMASNEKTGLNLQSAALKQQALQKLYLPENHSHQTSSPPMHKSQLDEMNTLMQSGSSGNRAQTQHVATRKQHHRASVKVATPSNNTKEIAFVPQRQSASIGYPSNGQAANSSTQKPQINNGSPSASDPIRLHKMMIREGHTTKNNEVKPEKSPISGNLSAPAKFKSSTMQSIYARDFSAKQPIDSTFSTAVVQTKSGHQNSGQQDKKYSSFKESNDQRDSALFQSNDNRGYDQKGRHPSISQQYFYPQSKQAQPLFNDQRRQAPFGKDQSSPSQRQGAPTLQEKHQRFSNNENEGSYNLKPPLAVQKRLPSAKPMSNETKNTTSYDESIRALLALDSKKIPQSQLKNDAKIHMNSTYGYSKDQNAPLLTDFIRKGSNPGEARTPQQHQKIEKHVYSTPIASSFDNRPFIKLRDANINRRV